MNVSVRSIGLDLSHALHAYARRKLTAILQKHSDKLVQATVRLADENGPRGGEDKRCSVVVQLGGRHVISESVDADPYAAIDAACRRLAHTLRRGLARRHLRRQRKPNIAHELPIPSGC